MPRSSAMKFSAITRCSASITFACGYIGPVWNNQKCCGLSTFWANTSYRHWPDLMYDLIVRNCTIVNGDQRPYPGSVAVVGTKIAAILPSDTDLVAHSIIDAQGKILFPGVIDPHVHYRYDCGYRSGDQDYLTETRTALIGGITTAIRMHRELTPYCESLPAELKLFTPASHIDMAFHLAIMTEQQL